jgi:tellurite resistance protein TerC
VETISAFWVIFVAFILGMLALDLGVFHSEAREVKPAEALKWSLFWVGTALAFATSLFVFEGQQASLDFLAGYAIEKSLSIDNIFVFSVIFQTFSIPLKYQHRLLFWGVIGALILRAAMIWLGIAVINMFHPIVYILGIFLVYTAAKMFWVDHKSFIETNPFMINFLQQYLPVTPEIRGQNLFVRKEHSQQWQVTPLFVALLAVEGSDLLFALDSIPAIFAITLDPFTVYTSNIFAILGLRSLYFLLADALKRFIFLKKGIALILGFVGLKILVMDIYKISVQWSLCMILVLLGGSIILSLFSEKRPCHK